MFGCAESTGNRAMLASMAFLVAGAFFSAARAQAAVITLTNGTLVTGFQATVSTGVGLSVTGGSGSSSAPWLLTETYTYNNLNPITLDYKYIGPPTAEPAAADYYFLVKENLTNSSGSAWSGYSWNMKDGNGTTFEAASHPDAAHFHSSTLTSYTPFTTLTAPGNAGNNGIQNMTVSNGTLANGGTTWNVSQIKMHDYGNNPTKTGATAGPTEFIVTETPVAVPEPLTAGIAAIGIFGLLALRLRPRRSLA